MKRFLTLVLLVMAMLCAVAGCGCVGENADLVFVNNSNSVIVAILADFTGQGSMVQYADSIPLKHGESFGFERGTYPVTLMVYDSVVEDFSEMAVAQFTITSTPPDGERWYVVAQDGKDGLMLSADNEWPEGV